jgi:hypothetical protein
MGINWVTCWPTRWTFTVVLGRMNSWARWDEWRLSNGIINGDDDRHSNEMTFVIWNLQNVRYRFFHCPSIIVGKILAPKHGILDRPSFVPTATTKSTNTDLNHWTISKLSHFCRRF